MKLAPKLIEEVISELVNEEVVPVVQLLRKRKNVSEYSLAESLKLTVNAVRNHLYRLYALHLVEFTRKKDRKKGWYIYYWNFNNKRFRELVEEVRRAKLEKLQDRLTREKSTHFYLCKNECLRLDFDHATDHNFKCPECGELMEREDNTQKIRALEKELAKMGAGAS